jgi:arylamine N-acetyltransferase
MLLKMALSDIGFRTRLGLARARWNVPRGQDVAKGHSVLFVGLLESEEEFLLEVAYGSLRMSSPIKLEEGLVQQTLHGTCRLMREPLGWVLQVEKPGGAWADVFLVEDAPVTAADIGMVKWALANRRGSSVREEVTLAIALEGGGRMAFAKGKLAVTENGKKVEEEVMGIEHLAKAVEKIGTSSETQILLGVLCGVLYRCPRSRACRP